MHWTEILFGYWLFLIPAAFSLAAWWAWARLLPAPRRRLDRAALAVPLLLLALAVWWGIRAWRAWTVTGRLDLWTDVIYHYGLLAGVILAGFLLMIAARRTRRLSRPARLAVLSSGLVSVVSLLFMLGLFWTAGAIAREPGAAGWPAMVLGAPLSPPIAGDIDPGRLHQPALTRWARTTLPLIYASALVLSAVLTWGVAKGLRAARVWPAPAVTAAVLAAFIVGSFFLPVEFFNSCYIGQALLPYTLC